MNDAGPQEHRSVARHGRGRLSAAHSMASKRLPANLSTHSFALDSRSTLRVASALVDVAVGDSDSELVAIAVAVGQMLGYRHRAVAPAGAADRDHQMGLALGHILRQ